MVPVKRFFAPPPKDWDPQVEKYCYSMSDWQKPLPECLLAFWGSRLLQTEFFFFWFLWALTSQSPGLHICQGQGLSSFFLSLYTFHNSFPSSEINLVLIIVLNHYKDYDFSLTSPTHFQNIIRMALLYFNVLMQC